MPQFTPKQSVPRTAEHMQEIMGNVTLQIARHFTQAVIETQKIGNVTIHATDLGPTMCKATSSLAASKGWEEYVKTAVVPAEALTFDDATFSHSFTNFLIFGVPDPDKVASNIYRTRTLQPGGVAVITTWATVAHEGAILAAHTATRLQDAKHAIQSREVWKKSSHLIGILEKVGFADVKSTQSDGFLLVKDLKRWATVAWSFLGPSTSGWG